MHRVKERIISIIMVCALGISLWSPVGASEVLAAEYDESTVAEYEIVLSDNASLETSDDGTLDLYSLLKVMKKENGNLTEVTTSKTEFSYVSSNESVAVISAAGEVTVKDGSTASRVDITVTWKGSAESETATKKFTVDVTQLSAKSITISETEKTLKVNESYNLSQLLTVQPAGAVKDLKYISSDDTVVSVSEEGLLEAKKEGSANITVSSKTNATVSATITIKVIDVPVSLKLNQTAFSMKATDTFQLEAFLVYTSGKEEQVYANHLTFVSENELIAEVDENGLVTGVVQSSYPATTKITVYYDYNGEKLSAQCDITVTKIPVEKIVITNKKEGVTWEIKDTYTLETTVSPENATDKTIKYKSSDKDVATVSSSGKITAVGIGEATITAYASENSSVLDTFLVKVYQTTFDIAKLGADGKDTTNDATQINKILKYAANEYLKGAPITVIIPDGTYYISQTLIVYPRTDIILSDNAVIKRFQRSGNVHMLKNHTDSSGKQEGYTQCSDITITGGTWDGNTTGDHDADCLYFGHAKNITIKNTTVKNNSGAHLIEFAGVQNALVENVELCGYTMCKEKGYTAYQSEKEAIQLDYCSAISAPAMKPYDNTACDNITIRNCNIHDYMAGIGTHTEGTKASTNIRIENNTFKNITNACINLRKFKNVTICKNTATNCTTFLYASGSQGRVENNKVTNGTSFKPAASVGLRAKNGVTVSNGSNFTIKNNTFQKAKSNGICVWNKSTAVIQNNKIQSNKLYGIRTQGSTITLSKNSFSKNSKGLYDTYKDAKVKSSDDIRAYYIDIKKRYKYKGKAVKPKITIKGLSKKYYKVSYKNNKKPGTATVTIKGKGKVKQTLKIKYKITR